MSPAAWIGIAILGGTLAIAFWRRSRLQRRRVRERLLTGTTNASRPRGIDDRMRDNHLIEAVEWLLMGWLAAIYVRILRRAGYHSPSAGHVYVALKSMASLLIAVSCAILFQRNDTLGLTFLAVIGIWVAADVVLLRMATAYTKAVTSDLPFWLDLHTTLVEGGMGFDEALARLCAETQFEKRPLFAELALAHRRIHLGVRRADALRAMSQALNVEEIGVVTSAIEQGERLGAGMVDALRAQAEMVRNRVWEEQQRRAHELPVKLIFPMALGVLPSLFLITVGPSLLQLLKFFEQSP